MRRQGKEKHLCRILYKRQPFPDNYVDDLFLKELRKNVNIRTYHMTEAIVNMGVVTQELCSVVLFAAIFVFLDGGHLPPQMLLFITLVGALVLYIIHSLFMRIPIMHSDSGQTTKKSPERSNPLHRVIDDGKLAMIYLILNFAFSPVLKTLTETISSDTVYAMATTTMVVHLVTHDYGPSFPIVCAPLSFNAALLGVVCLASRLPDSMSTFALLTTSVEMFALLPHFRHQLHKICGHVGRAGITTFIVCITATVLFMCSPLLSMCLILVVIFINLVCPVWFVQMQKYKENLYGPWDEAILKPL